MSVRGRNQISCGRVGDTVRAARIQQGYTQKQPSDILDIDERSIISIENYKSNTTIEILYPLLRLLKSDAREIFNPELVRESRAHYRLRLLLDNCTADEAETLLSVCETVISALRSKDGVLMKYKSLHPLVFWSWLCVFCIWLGGCITNSDLPIVACV